MAESCPLSSEGGGRRTKYILTIYFQHNVLPVQEVSVLSVDNLTCLHHKKFESGREVKAKDDMDT